MIFEGGGSFQFDNSYVRLPERFYARLGTNRASAPRLIRLNRELAGVLGLDAEGLAGALGAEIFSGNRVAEGSEPIAMAYAGHQFGHFVPRLGDGRTSLLGEVVGRDGVRYDIQLKGSGPTPFSRRGDGRAALGPVLREYILSEAMAALGVPTTRALAAVATGDNVYRETELPGAVFTRVAASHLRVGTFQYFLAQGDVDGLRALADYAIGRHYPEAAETGAPYRALLRATITRQAELVARWMGLGFIHGVMNTDNMSISGETIDYGPCAWMEAYKPGQVYSSIDRAGRYGYGNQPHAARWNLARLAEALLPLLEMEAGSKEVALEWAYEDLDGFDARYAEVYLNGMRRKLGFMTEREGDAALIDDLLARMAANGADFTLTFRRLCDAAGTEGDARVRELFAEPVAYDVWARVWRERLAGDFVTAKERVAAMRRVNPLFVPRNHLVEAVIEAATVRGDFVPFEELLEVVVKPFEEQPGRERYAAPARVEELVTATFCGT